MDIVLDQILSLWIQRVEKNSVVILIQNVEMVRWTRGQHNGLTAL